MRRRRRCRCRQHRAATTRVAAARHLVVRRKERLGGRLELQLLHRQQNHLHFQKLMLLRLGEPVRRCEIVSVSTFGDLWCYGVEMCLSGTRIVETQMSTFSRPCLFCIAAQCGLDTSGLDQGNDANGESSGQRSSSRAHPLLRIIPRTPGPNAAPSVLATPMHGRTTASSPNPSGTSPSGNPRRHGVSPLATAVPFSSDLMAEAIQEEEEANGVAASDDEDDGGHGGGNDNDGTRGQRPSPVKVVSSLESSADEGEITAADFNSAVLHCFSSEDVAALRATQSRKTSEAATGGAPAVSVQVLTAPDVPPAVDAAALAAAAVANTRAKFMSSRTAARSATTTAGRSRAPHGVTAMRARCDSSDGLSDSEMLVSAVSHVTANDGCCWCCARFVPALGVVARAPFFPPCAVFLALPLRMDVVRQHEAGSVTLSTTLSDSLMCAAISAPVDRVAGVKFASASAVDAPVVKQAFVGSGQSTGLLHTSSSSGRTTTVRQRNAKSGRLRRNRVNSGGSSDDVDDVQKSFTPKSTASPNARTADASSSALSASGGAVSTPPSLSSPYRDRRMELQTTVSLPVLHSAVVSSDDGIASSPVRRDGVVTSTGTVVAVALGPSTSVDPGTTWRGTAGVCPSPIRTQHHVNRSLHPRSRLPALRTRPQHVQGSSDDECGSTTVEGGSVSAVGGAIGSGIWEAPSDQPTSPSGSGSGSATGASEPRVAIVSLSGSDPKAGAELGPAVLFRSFPQPWVRVGSGSQQRVK